MCAAFERPGWDEYFMLQAELAKLRSNCMIKSVGAVIVQNNRQLATGYNGTPPGVKNCHEGGCPRCTERAGGTISSGEGLERCLCNHAEANAIMHCAILGISTGSSGVSLYSTMVPCLECTKMAVTIGVRKIVCLEKYAETDMGLAADAGIKIISMDRSRIEYWAGKLAAKYSSKS